MDADFDNNSSDEHSHIHAETSTKKRCAFGSVKTATKRLRDSTYEPGEDCECKRLECFKQVTLSERNNLLNNFNKLSDRNAQNSYLAGLISLIPVERRRPRQPAQDARLHDFSYVYKVRVLREGKIEKVNVCFKAFMSFFGVTARRLHTIKVSLAATGQPPVDRRGKHENRGKSKLPQETYEAMTTFFSSLKGRKAHYCLQDTKKMYLPEDLNVKKLLVMFLECYPHVQISYEKFRHTFVTKFNIAFGYPRSDTCSTCDEQKASANNVETAKTKTCNPEEIKKLDEELRKLHDQMKLHKLQADWFYKRKIISRNEAKQDVKREAIVIDFGKNLPLQIFLQMMFIIVDSFHFMCSMFTY